MAAEPDRLDSADWFNCVAMAEMQPGTFGSRARLRRIGDLLNGGLSSARLYGAMGIGIVLLFWAVVFVIAAVIGSLFLGGVTSLIMLNVEHGHREVICKAFLFPFACLAWFVIMFVFQAIVNTTFLHRDIGIGEEFTCPLPNGYVISMMDDTDQGMVYNPRTQTTPSGIVGQEDAPFGVRVLQVAGRYILGGADSRHLHRGGTEAYLDSFFLLDTEVGKRTTFPDYDALSDAAGRMGIQLNLEPIDRIYYRYRYSWFDLFASLLFVVPLMMGFGFLVRRIIRLRRPLACTGCIAESPIPPSP